MKDFFRLIQNKCRHYALGPTLQEFVHTTAFQNCLFLLGVLAFVRACFLLAPQTLIPTTSNAVNGRELPIYCVQTDQKKVALSFDAAWGGRRLRRPEAKPYGFCVSPSLPVF